MWGKGGKLSPRGEAILAVWTALVVLALVSAGCMPIRERLGLIDKPATATAEAVIVEQRLLQTRAVENELATVAAATEQAAATATRAFEYTATASAEAEETAVAQVTMTAAAQETQAALQTATQQAAGMLGVAQGLVKDGLLPSEKGLYYKLDDYTGQQNKANFMTIRGTGVSSQSFVIRADVDYESAGSAPDWSRSACGFMFWRKDAQNYYQSYVGLDGNIYAVAVKDNKFVGLGKAYYALPKRPAGSYQVMLVANPKGFTVFYNGKAMKTTRAVENSITTGSLNLTVVSSYTKDFGMRCTFRNIEIWVVE